MPCGLGDLKKGIKYAVGGGEEGLTKLKEEIFFFLCKKGGRFSLPPPLNLDFDPLNTTDSNLHMWVESQA